MRTLPEIEAAVWTLNADELKQLESTVRKARQAKREGPLRSVLDLPPLEIGRLIQPLSADDDLLGEMLDDVRF